MIVAEQRKKPVKLEFTSEILSSAPNDALEVRIKGRSAGLAPSPKNTQPPVTIQGTVKLRREVKGRAGKPVSVLFGFDDPAARDFNNLRNLQSKLKETLACGGTADEQTSEIILQVDDLARVRGVLQKLGFQVKG
jgi:translation initiation factor 1 (eIF-1/SUI1)